MIRLTPIWNVSSAPLRSLPEERGLTLRGITTDGSSLYRQPIVKVFGPVAHEVCEFHTLKEPTGGMLRAVAEVRKRLAGGKPKLGRAGRRRPQRVVGLGVVNGLTRRWERCSGLATCSSSVS
ncbi:MAG TPA: hypothetical protein EYH34_18715 [Planctomycetes bacterium]|nr:hypothetical protein [Planctomycetota bacterium]